MRVTIRPGEASAHGPIRPLVLCNGIGAPLELLGPFVHALPPSVEVVRWDVPGTGGSPLPDVPYTFHSLSFLLGKILDKLGYGEVDVLGISWGGGLAQQFAFQNPRRCRRLILVSTGTGMMMVPAKPSVLKLMLTARRYNNLDYAMANADKLYGGKIRTHPETAIYLLHGGPRVGTLGYTLQLGAGLGWSTLPWLRCIRQQTLVMSGTDDPIIPLINAKILAAGLPNATLHTFDDGHLGLLTSADELAPVVATFLS